MALVRRTVMVASKKNSNGCHRLAPLLIVAALCSCIQAKLSPSMPFLRLRLCLAQLTHT